MTTWEQVLDELVRARGRALVRYATLLTGDEREGEDLVQDALVRCFSQGRPIRDPGAAESYVRQAILTIFLDAYRRRARWTAVRHLLARDDDTADHGPASTARLDVQAALLTLPAAAARLRGAPVLRRPHRARRSPVGSRSPTAPSSGTSSTPSASSRPCWARCPTRTRSTSSWSRQE